MAKRVRSKNNADEEARSASVKEASRLTEISRKLLGMADDTYQIKSDIH